MTTDNEESITRNAPVVKLPKATTSNSNNNSNNNNGTSNARSRTKKGRSTGSVKRQPTCETERDDDDYDDYDKDTTTTTTSSSSSPNNTANTVASTFSRLNVSRLPTGVQTSESIRVVAVRYFLDRPGYGLHNSAMRLWWHPPALCPAKAIADFLQAQGIAMEGLLVELYLDQFESFMHIDACREHYVEWDFTHTSAAQPGRLNVRLTDLALAQHEEEHGTSGDGKLPCGASTNALAVPTTAAAAAALANVTPSGLFSFSMMVALETAALLIQLVPNNRAVTPAFYLSWGPYMFFVGGILQLIVGIFQVLRNNVYGATAFLGFGSFWLSNGSIVILKTYFATPDTLADDLVALTDPVGDFIRLFLVLAFCCGLEAQTLAMNKLSTTLIGLLCAKVLVSSLAGFAKGHGALWTQFVLGVLTSFVAFYLFLVEFTNQVYQREVFAVRRWSEENSPEETFGAAGRTGTLFSKAARLRRAQAPTPRLLREVTKVE